MKRIFTHRIISKAVVVIGSTKGYRHDRQKGLNGAKMIDSNKMGGGQFLYGRPADFMGLKRGRRFNLY